MLDYFVVFEDDEGMRNDVVTLEEPITSRNSIRFVERELRRRKPEAGKVVLVDYKLMTGAAATPTPARPGDGLKPRTRAPRTQRRGPATVHEGRHRAA